MSDSHGRQHGKGNRCRSQDIADTSRKTRKRRAIRRTAKNGGKNVDDANGGFVNKGYDK